MNKSKKVGGVFGKAMIIFSNFLSVLEIAGTKNSKSSQNIFCKVPCIWFSAVGIALSIYHLLRNGLTLLFISNSFPQSGLILLLVFTVCHEAPAFFMYPGCLTFGGCFTIENLCFRRRTLARIWAR